MDTMSIDVAPARSATSVAAARQSARYFLAGLAHPAAPRPPTPTPGPGPQLHERIKGALQALKDPLPGGSGALSYVVVADDQEPVDGNGQRTAQLADGGLLA